jgi:hypothetical protein
MFLYASACSGPISFSKDLRDFIWFRGIVMRLRRYSDYAGALKHTSASTHQQEDHTEHLHVDSEYGRNHSPSTDK